VAKKKKLLHLLPHLWLRPQKPLPLHLLKPHLLPPLLLMPLLLMQLPLLL
jgi:hypothetical protein